MTFAEKKLQTPHGAGLDPVGVRLDCLLEQPGFSLDAEWEVGTELAVLFGYSGSGKSLTLQAIAGLLAPTSGSIEIAGKPVFDREGGVDVSPQRRELGYVTQDPALFPHLTVAANVEYGLAAHSREERTSRAQEMLESFGLKRLAHRRPGDLSGGERQRVALARALARSPRALLLDEPFSALDLPVRSEMRELVRDVQREFAVPVVLVTHDLYEAYTMADRMVVYSGNGLIQVGTPCELFKSPASSEIETLLSSERLFMCG